MHRCFCIGSFPKSGCERLRITASQAPLDIFAAAAKSYVPAPILLRNVVVILTKGRYTLLVFTACKHGVNTDV